MAIKSINTLNQVSDFEELASRYNYYALSNLGQRLGVQESSITTRSFKIGDFFTLNDINDYCLKIDYDIDEDIVSFIPFNFISNEVNTPIKINIKETQEITEKIELLQVINDVKFYNNGLVGYNPKTEHFYYSFECYADNTTINNNDRLNNENFIQYILEEYDHNTDELLYSLKICKNLFVSNGTNVPTISYLYKEDDNYKLRFFQITPNYDTGDDRIFDDIITHIENALKRNNIFVPYIYEEYIKPFIENDSQEIRNIFTANDNEVIDLNYNNEDNIFFSITDYENLRFKDHTKINDLYLRSNNINTFLNLYSEEISYLYTYVKKYYTNISFLENNNHLKLRIFAEFVREITNNLLTNKGDIITLYAPMDYLVNYFCKTDNTNHIYESSSGLFVEFTNSDDIDYENLKYITVQDNNERKISIYRFNVLYEDSDVEEDLIYDIKILYDYTLPYISSKNYWVVNNKETKIYAKGRNAGQPNLIFIYNTSNLISEEVINENQVIRNVVPVANLIYAANKKSVFYVDTFENEFNEINFNNSTSNIHWKEEEIKLKGLYTLNNEIVKGENNISNTNYNETYYLLKTKVIDYEKYDEVLQEELFNSIIINITSVKNVCFKSNKNLDDLENIYGEEGYVTTFWILEKDYNGQYQYKCMNDPYNSEFSLDLNVLNSVNSLILWHLKKFESISPDNFKHKQLIIDCSYVTSKNQTDDDYTILNKEIFGAIRGLETTHLYNSDISSSSSNLYQDNYNNSTNLVIDFVDTITYNVNDKRVIENVYKNTGDEGKNTWFRANESKKFITNYINTYDYIPNTNIPTLELKEILLRNPNFINRNNIVILDRNDPYYYYSYTGSPYNKKEKNTFVIGTGTVNKSFGTHNMSDSNNFFGEQSNIEINFKDNIFLNAKYSYVNTLNVNSVKLNNKLLDKSFIYYKNGNTLVVEGYLLSRDSGYLEEYNKNSARTLYLFNIKNFIEDNFNINIRDNGYILDFDHKLIDNKILLKYICAGGSSFRPIRYRITIYDWTVKFVEVDASNKWIILSKKKNINI